MIIDIAVAVIAASFVLILIRVYTLSIRIEESIRRFEELLSRIETDIRPILYDTRDVVSNMKGIMEIAKRGTKRIDQVLEDLLGPIQTLGIFIKAIRRGINTFLKRKGGDDNGM
jgi:uncharacterized protein YoxC